MPLGVGWRLLLARSRHRRGRAGAEEGRPVWLHGGSYIAIELNTRTPVPEWDGQEVYAMQEDPAWLTSEGWRFFVPRQEAYYLIP